MPLIIQIHLTKTQIIRQRMQKDRNNSQNLNKRVQCPLCRIFSNIPSVKTPFVFSTGV